MIEQKVINKENKVIAILQARMSSSRLPGKVLKLIVNKPMLVLQIERIKMAKNLDQFVVATSDDPSDDAIEQLCQQLKVECFRGSLPDVLDRFYQATKIYQGQHIVRLTGDCPLSDASIIDQAIVQHLASKADYTTNSILPDDPSNKITYPDGLDVEVITMNCLTQLWKNTRASKYREHVTSYIRSHTDKYNISYLHHPTNLSKYRWTVDEAEDFVLVEKIFQALYVNKPNFSYIDVVSFIETHPELTKINNHLQHKNYREQ